MAELATTYVRIRPRTTGFKEEADSKLKKAKPSDIDVQVSADTRTAEERLTVLKDRLDTLRTKVAEARVRLDGDDRALGKLAELDAAMIRLDRARANPKIDLEGVARAEGQIAALNVQLDKLAVKERLAGRGGAGGGGGLFSRLAGYGSQGGFFAPKGLIGAGVALAPAAFPLAAAGLGAGASFLTPTVAGTAGLGLFTAASKSAVTRVSKVEDQLQKLNKRIANTPQTNPAGTPAQIAAAQARVTAAEASLRRAQYVGGTARITSAQASLASAQSSLQSAQGGGPNKTYENLVKQRKQLLSSLTPAEHHAAEGIERLEKGWLKFQRAVEPETFKAVGVGTGILTRGLHDLLPMTKAVGDEVVDLEKRASKALQDPFWQHFFGVFLTREAPRAVDSLGTTLGNVVEGIARLSERFAPLGHDLENFLVGSSSGFNKWTQGEGPKKFLDLVERDGPIAADALKGIAHGLEGLGKGLEPIGRVELQALTPVLEFIGTLGKEHPRVITALGVAYLSVAGGLKAIAAVKGLEGIAGILTGGRIGGGGGRLGGFGGTLSSPVPVYVTNWGGKGSFPGARGKGVGAGEAGEGGAVTGAGARIAAKLGLTGITRLAGPLALTYAATAGGDQNAAQVGTNRAYAGVPSGVAAGLQKLIAGLPASGNYFTGAIDSPNRGLDIHAIVQATVESGSQQQRALLDQLSLQFGPLGKALSGLESELRFGNLNPNVAIGGRGLGGNLNPNVEHGGQVVNNFYNLPNATFTNVNSPQALGRALQSQQRQRALSGIAPQGQRRAADFYG